jgi:hypothetical protein
VRSDSLDQLTGAGWSSLVDYGIRTIVDLRNPYERSALAPGPVASRHVPLDDVEDRAFWDRWDDEPPPLYYGPFLERKPDRVAAVVAAVAAAPPGGVVFHCGGGRDRTGLVALLLLALAGVEHEAIVRDYELSFERMRAYYAARGEDDEGARQRALLARAGTTAREVLLALLEGLDVDALLSHGDAEAVRRRLRPPGAGTRPPPARGSGRRSAS